MGTGPWVEQGTQRPRGPGAGGLALLWGRLRAQPVPCWNPTTQRHGGAVGSWRRTAEDTAGSGGRPGAVSDAEQSGVGDHPGDRLGDPSLRAVKLRDQQAGPGAHA